MPLNPPIQIPNHHHRHDSFKSVPSDHPSSTEPSHDSTAAAAIDPNHQHRRFSLCSARLVPPSAYVNQAHLAKPVLEPSLPWSPARAHLHRISPLLPGRHRRRPHLKLCCTTVHQRASHHRRRPMPVLDFHSPPVTPAELLRRLLLPSSLLSTGKKEKNLAGEKERAETEEKKHMGRKEEKEREKEREKKRKGSLTR